MAREVEGILELLQDMMGYLQHHSYCGELRFVEKPCSCGLSRLRLSIQDTLAKARAEAEKERG